jgi:two-component system sensor histidine kinase QseC
VLTLTSILVPAVLRHELAPLGELAAQAQRIEAESLSGRFTTSGLPGELVPISSRLNDLLQRLQKSFDRERQFSDDLAHEFRTPIAELRSLAEFSLKWPENRDEEMDKNVLTIALQMENIITSLLAIARGSMGAVTIAAMPVELGELVSSVCAAFQSRAETRGLKFHVVLPSNFKIHTDPTLFRSIVTNLLDNAVEYSQSGSVIKIKGESLDGRFGLGIGNKAERLESSDLPHLFDRFWRKDTARSGGEHSGLGLTLVQAFATSLGYSLKASLDEPGELTMYLSGLVDLPIHGKTISTEQKK